MKNLEVKFVPGDTAYYIEAAKAGKTVAGKIINVAANQSGISYYVEFPEGAIEGDPGWYDECRLLTAKEVETFIY